MWRMDAYDEYSDVSMWQKVTQHHSTSQHNLNQDEARNDSVLITNRISGGEEMMKRRMGRSGFKNE